MFRLFRKEKKRKKKNTRMSYKAECLKVVKEARKNGTLEVVTVEIK